MVGGQGSKKTMCSKRVQVWEMLLTLRAGWSHRPEALGSIIRAGLAVKYPACRHYESGYLAARNASLLLIDWQYR
jgi:hypothetical protein